MYRYPRKSDAGETYTFDELPTGVAVRLVCLMMLSGASPDQRYLHIDHGMRLKDKYVLYDEPFDEYLARELP